MSYLDIYRSIFIESTLRARVMVAVTKAAFNVLGEPNTANKVKRVEWAKNALVNPDVATNQIIWPIASDAKVIAGTVTDAELQTIVNGLIDIFAGV